MCRLLYFPTEEISSVDIKLKLLSPNISLSVFLIGDYEGQHIITKSVNLTPSNEPISVELTSEVTGDIDTLMISLQSPSDIGSFYVDDLTLITQ